MNIHGFYKTMCQNEHVSPIPLKFGNVGKGGACLIYNAKTFEPLSIKIDKNRLDDIAYGLYHEFAHQICLIKYKYAGHGVKFRKIFNYINEKNKIIDRKQVFTIK